MKLLLQAVVLALFSSLAQAAAPIADFPAACGVAPSEGFYHVETAVSRDGQQVKSIDYYAALPRVCWDDVADYADAARHEVRVLLGNDAGRPERRREPQGDAQQCRIGVLRRSS